MPTLLRKLSHVSSLLPRLLPLLPPLLLLLLLAPMAPPRAGATVFLVTRENATFSFDDADAAFGGMIPPGGMQGILRQAVPYDGCAPLDQSADPSSPLPQFALIVRGNCQFDVKVLNAQSSGYAAAVIYNNEDNPELVTMSGRHLWDVYIPAVFVTLSSGKQMLSLTEQMDTVCFLAPAFDNTAWSVMTASFLSLLALCSVLTLFMYIRRARLRELAVRMLEREPLGMTANEVKALPEVTFREGAPETAGLETCAICLDDYEEEDVLRLLPCKHGFHAPCIDQWLTTRSPCCPVCKRDCKDTHLQTPAEEEEEGGAGGGADGTPLLLQGQRGLRFQRFFHLPVRGVPGSARFSFLSIFMSQGSLEAPLLPVTMPQPDAPAAPQAEAQAPAAPQAAEPVEPATSDDGGSPRAHQLSDTAGEASRAAAGAGGGAGAGGVQPV